MADLDDRVSVTALIVDAGDLVLVTIPPDDPRSPLEIGDMLKRLQEAVSAAKPGVRVIGIPEALGVKVADDATLARLGLMRIPAEAPAA